MGKFVIIGLGNFGFYLARSLSEEDKEVIAVELRSLMKHRISHNQ